MSQPLASRLCGARLMGTLVPVLSPAAVERKLLGCAAALCQDTSHVVRECMASNLAALVKVVRYEEFIMIISSAASECSYYGR